MKGKDAFFNRALFPILVGKNNQYWEEVFLNFKVGYDAVKYQEDIPGTKKDLKETALDYNSTNKNNADAYIHILNCLFSITCPYWKQSVSEKCFHVVKSVRLSVDLIHPDVPVLSR